TGQTFNERFAAWQNSVSGRQPMQGDPYGSTMTAPPRSRVIPASQNAPAPVTQTVPEGMEGQSQKVLSNVYSAPVHAPNYNAPWTNNQCATCGHNQTFEPASDPIGTCGYGGGGWLGGTVPGGACCGGGNCGQCGDCCGGGWGHGGCNNCGQCGGAG